MKRFDLWSHEIGRAGPAALVMPPALVLLTGLLALFGTRLGSLEGNTAWMLLGAVEAGFPLMTGIAAASLIGRDPAVELQLTLPSGYRVTLLRRLAVTSGWAALCATAATALFMATGWWDVVPGTPGGLAGQLTWLAPTVWLTALGLLAAAAFRSTVAATTTVAMVWLLEQVVGDVLRGNAVTRSLYLFATSHGAGADDWSVNRVTLLVTAMALLAAAWPLLGDAERVLGGETE
ncbi:hypothetical protein AB0B89_13315 [Sphaerisporangium sp. NPDC049002]|uniref:hypothetical protein n=1 Tax=unclassified Sphaerisporangium TaxID=2630420 RepID=UPI003407D864